MPHTFRLPEDLDHKVTQQANDVSRRLAKGEIIPYPQFVANLFKQMGDEGATLHHATTGCATEAGELLDASKKVWIYGKQVNLENVVEELGDLRFYYQAILNMLNLTDTDIQAANMYKLSLGQDARYPEGVYSDARAQERRDKVAEVERNFIGMNNQQTSGE